MNSLEVKALINDQYIKRIGKIESYINSYGDILSNSIRKIIKEIYFSFFKRNIIVNNISLFFNGKNGSIIFKVELGDYNSINQNIFDKVEYEVLGNNIKLDLDLVDDYYRVLKTDTERDSYRNWKLYRNFRSIESFIDGIKYII